jgi:hypothetical protein
MFFDVGLASKWILRLCVGECPSFELLARWGTKRNSSALGRNYQCNIHMYQTGAEH